jgi:hypothetical protein
MPDMTKVFPLESYEAEDDEDRALFLADVAGARELLLSHNWCEAVHHVHFGIAVPGVVFVGLADIEPLGDADPQLWVLVGDIPPAYLVTDDLPNPALALQAYLDHMEAWIDAVEAGENTAALMPVNAPPTSVTALALRTRVAFLRRELLSAYRDDLLA